MMEMVGSDTEKTVGMYNLSGLVMEYPREKRKRKTPKHIDTRTGDRD
jgi:hypothetical protein